MAIATVDMTGKQVMITGCTAGLGQAAAMALAEMGADLSLVCRNRSKGEALAAEIRAVNDKGADLYIANMGSRRDIRRIAQEFSNTGRSLDVLFNNAGVIMQRPSTTEDGFETTFGVNHLGYFQLTLLLIDRLKSADSARVVNTASDAYKFGVGRLDFDNLHEVSNYSLTRAYGSSKLANILFTRELARRLAGTRITVNSFHPGFVGSDFAKNNGSLARITMALLKPFARSPLKGAETGLYLCTSPKVEGVSGEHFYNCAEHATKAAARNDEDALRLWELSEKLTGASL